ncbi:hypothetical protein GCM10010508_16170 [Streptomyces naganishii JCM 4654]|uniref:Uncharacterized protein n=1 Tax=Streptomyces naganishii JCM 4654 TaxID=1306179 RepID=A0A918Y2B8_9ACTN|nr:hypothetical protein GCM10010508_16170 [Streptomyces naganishii JCM 4654]
MSRSKAGGRPPRLPRFSRLSTSLSHAQKQIAIAWLAGENPRHSPEVHESLHQLPNAAFDADLIGTWEKCQRPYEFETVGGHYRFGLQS